MQTVAPSPIFSNIQQAQFSAPRSVQPAYPLSLNVQPQIQPAQTVQAFSPNNFVQNVPQGNVQNMQTASNAAPEKKGGILNSVLDVGKTVAGGVAVGTISGGLVSLMPFDNTDLIAASLHDTILEAARENDTLPENLKNAQEPFNMAKEIMKAQEGYSNIRIKETLLAAQLKLAEALDDDAIKSTLAELSETLKGTGIDIAEIPSDIASNSAALESLKTNTLLKITEAINKNASEIGDAAKSSALENLLSARNTFIESIKKFIKEAPAGDEILASAKTQAKIANSFNLISRAISFAVIIALIAKLFDIIQPKKEKTEKTPENNSQTPQGTTQGGNVWNVLVQNASQGPNSLKSVNKFMTLG